MVSRNRKAGKKSVFKEWGDAILFAVIAASAIRTYVFEPYKIPTGSMEKTLLIGDHLFVDKLTYGPRLPMTPFSYPIVHNSFAPVLDMKSYTTIQTIPYTRLPGFRFVERNDVTVFNFPAGDTALNDTRMPDGLVGHNYHEILADEALLICLGEGNNVDFFESKKEYYKKKARKHFEKGEVRSRLVRQEDEQRGYTAINGVLDRPVDKKENYIKRCVAVYGDVVEIKDKELYVNGELAFQAPHMQYNYVLKGTPHPGLDFMRDQNPANDYAWMTAEREKFYLDNFGATLLELQSDAEGNVVIPMSKEFYNKAKTKFPGLENISKPKGFYKKALYEEADFFLDMQSKGYKMLRGPRYYPVFPNDPQYDWTEDNFGPLKIPAAGDKVALDATTIPLYRRIITAYENHTLEEKADGIYIDGKKAETYTIEQNYYWLMGDNRNNSADSRFWGFVPEDHVVGHAAFIWLSADQQKGMFGGGMRWSRIFSGID
jgi:signal peptidase I